MLPSLRQRQDREKGAGTAVEYPRARLYPVEAPVLRIIVSTTMLIELPAFQKVLRTYLGCPGIEVQLRQVWNGAVCFHFISFPLSLMGFINGDKNMVKMARDRMTRTLCCLIFPRKQPIKEHNTRPWFTARTEQKAWADCAPTGSGGPPKEKMCQAAKFWRKLWQMGHPEEEDPRPGLKGADGERRAT